jgi:dolichol-phosphate mannosyltransferase
MNSGFSERIAVVIPTRDEEATVGAVIDAVRPYTGNIFVIDGNSCDRTREIAVQHGATVIVQSGRGKGGALRQALRELSQEIVVFIDADGSHDAADLRKMVQPVIEGKADMVVASRYLGGSDELHGSWNNFVRMVGSSLVTLGINYRWNAHLTDVENGYRAVRRTAALEAGLTAPDFTIEQEMVMKMLKKGCRVAEVASHEYERKAGVSKLPTSQGWKFILQFIKDIV